MISISPSAGLVSSALVAFLKACRRLVVLGEVFGDFYSSKALVADGISSFYSTFLLAELLGDAILDFLVFQMFG